MSLEGVRPIAVADAPTNRLFQPGSQPIQRTWGQPAAAPAANSAPAWALSNGNQPAPTPRELPSEKPKRLAWKVGGSVTAGLLGAISVIIVTLILLLVLTPPTAIAPSRAFVQWDDRILIMMVVLAVVAFFAFAASFGLATHMASPHASLDEETIAMMNLVLERTERIDPIRLEEALAKLQTYPSWDQLEERLRNIPSPEQVEAVVREILYDTRQDFTRLQATQRELAGQIRTHTHIAS